LRRAGDASVDHRLYYGRAETGSAVRVSLPADLDEGDDYYIHVTEHHMARDYEGTGKAFFIGTGTDVRPVPHTEWRVDVLNPEADEEFYDEMGYTFRWKTYPTRLPIPERFTLRFISQDTSRVEYSREAQTATIFNDIIYNATTKIFSWRFKPTLDPGSYRLEIEAQYDDLDGSPLNESFSGQSGVFTLLPVPTDEGVSLNTPLRDSLVHAGGSVSVRWSYPPVLEEAYGPPSSVRIQIYNGSNFSLREHYLRENPSDPTTLMHDLSIPEDFPEGEYTIVVTVNFTEGHNETDLVFPVNILPSEGLFFVWPRRTPNLVYGHMYPIQWNALGDAADQNIDIQLTRDGAVVETLATGVRASRRSWEWNLDINCNDADMVHQGENYRIKLVGEGSSPFEAVSVPVNIALPQLIFNRGSPREGDRWPLHSSRQVLWTPQDIPEGSTLKIELWKGGDFLFNLATGVLAERDFWEWPSVGEYGALTLPADDDYSFRLVLECCERVFSQSPRFAIVNE
jgi:hypothetical protein